MPLPKIDMPTYDLVIPSSGQTIKVRPFNVKEEKLLLIAMESENVDEIINTVKQVINNCIVVGEVNIDKLPYFDVDYIFIFLRSKSLGDHVEVTLTCNNVVDNELCGHSFKSNMDISKVEIVRPEGISDTIDLGNGSGVKMKYPNYAALKRIEAKGDVDEKTSVIVSSIEQIFDKDGVYPARDYSKEELKEFVEGLTEANYKKLERFVDNSPTFAVTFEEDCGKCGFHHKVRYTDFYDFFT
jgi:hypothetical protein